MKNSNTTVVAELQKTTRTSCGGSDASGGKTRGPLQEAASVHAAMHIFIVEIEKFLIKVGSSLAFHAARVRNPRAVGKLKYRCPLPSAKSTFAITLKPKRPGPGLGSGRFVGLQDLPR